VVQHFNGIPEQLQVSALCIGKDHSVWVSSYAGLLFQFDNTAGKFTCKNVLYAAALKNTYVTTLSMIPSGELMVGTTTGLSLYNPKTNTYKHLLGKAAGNLPVFVRNVLKYSADIYWVASETGVHIINLKSGENQVLKHDDEDPYSLSDNSVYTLYKDLEGGIWGGTYFSGINYYHSRYSYFRKYFRKHDERSLSGNAIRELYPNGNGEIWVGTEDAGLNKLNPNTSEVKRYQISGSPSSDNIHALVISNGELWVGTFQQGLDVIDISTGKRVRQYKADPNVNGLRSNFIISACKKRSGELLFGTSNGVYSYEREKDRFRLLSEFPKHSYVFSIIEDHDGVIWAATIGNGLYYYNPANGEKGNYRASASGQKGISSNSVCSVYEDSRNRIWLSTEGGGLCLYNRSNKTFIRYNTGTGLPSNMVYKVLEDKLGHIWISTSRGLVMHTPAQNSWKVYNKTDGLLTDQFNYSSGYASPDGTLYFGSVKGLIAFNPANMDNMANSPPVYVTSLQVNNQDLNIDKNRLEKAISYTDSLKLNYKESTISIAFAALSYLSGNTLRYRYRMDGMDRHWNTLGINRRIYYTSLPPGEYTFKVMAISDNGKIKSNVKKLFIRITPPWWDTSVAYLVYTLVVLSSLYLLINAYHRRQQERHRRKLAFFNQAKEKEIYNAKIDFFTNVAHEIRTPLTLIIGPLEMVMDEVGELPAVRANLKSIEKNTERLVKLTDQLLDFRSTENYGFSLNFVRANIPDLIKENIQAFALLSTSSSIAIDLNLPDRNFFAFIDKEAFNKITTNLLGNAVKYAASVIKVKLTVIEEDQRKFVLKISNDGPLIPWHLREKIFEPFYRINEMEKPGSGIGLALARALAELHNGALELVRFDDHLNTFVLTLPVHQKIEFKLRSIKKKDNN
ncbi:MAG: hybrid sensor histidine kinase/response regulator, partial [Mucilaginibacter sp.]|nr:hybrid sensor histidine kinase/response regulator [Mucilaginibacter sp.]